MITPWKSKDHHFGMVVLRSSMFSMIMACCFLSKNNTRAFVTHFCWNKGSKKQLAEKDMVNQNQIPTHEGSLCSPPSPASLPMLQADHLLKYWDFHDNKYLRAVLGEAKNTMEKWHLLPNWKSNGIHSSILTHVWDC